jgi:predicted dithiol-disulfide oxidoreductase (DUF899 family)
MTTEAKSAWTRPPEWLRDQRSETDHRIGTREDWAAAREELLTREKEHTRVGDELARQRRELPWVRVDEDYRLDTDDVTMLFVSQAPLKKVQACKRRMGWDFPWVSSANSEFNLDLG